MWGIGVQPVRIEVMTLVKGLAFEETYKQSQFYNEEGLQIRFLHLDHLLRSKKAAGRFKDLDDIEQLTRE